MEEKRVNEAAGANSAAGSFGLSFGLLSFSFTHMTDNGAVIASAQQGEIATTVGDTAEVMSKVFFIDWKDSPRPTSLPDGGRITSLSISTPDPAALAGVNGVELHDGPWHIEAGFNGAPLI